MSRRVWITGVGTVSAFGVGAPALWEGLCAGRCAIGRVESLDLSGFPCRLGAEVRGFSAREHVPKWYRKATKVMARDTQLAVGAARAATDDAKLVTKAWEDGGEPTYPPGRVACHIGAGLIAAEVDELTPALVSARSESGDGLGGVDLGAWGESGLYNLQPLWLLKYLPNMLACHVTIVHGLAGASNTITCAEASGLLSIGESARVIEREQADAAVAGGVESKLNLMGVARMTLAGRLAEASEDADPAGVVRAYDESGRGAVIGEGGGLLVLEAEESARARGARAYAEAMGFGSAMSLAPSLPPAGEGVDADGGIRRAVEAALADAGVGPEEIDAIVPHASGSWGLDSGELGALRSVFGERLGEIPLVTLVPMVGECWAGHGALAAAVGALCVREGRLPARLHGGRPVAGADAGPAASREARCERVLVCTGALGGPCAAMVLGAIRN